MTSIVTGRRPPAPPVTDGFRWWPELIVRGAGFAASGVLDLADAELGKHADEAAAGADPAAWQRFREQFEAATTAMGQRLRDIAASPSFQHAVTWQNHSLL